MAIKRNINSGDVLWKEREEQSYTTFNRATGAYDWHTRTLYYVYVLTTRRARTHGAFVSKKLVPFFKALSIRVDESDAYAVPSSGADPTSYIAVGVEQQRLHSEGLYESTQVCSQALAYYEKIKNRTLTPLLERRNGDTEIISEMKSLLGESEMEGELVEEAAEDWPEPPHFAVYSLDPESAYRRRFR